MLLESLIRPYASLQNYINSLKPTYLFGYIIWSKKRQLSHFISHMNEMDAEGKTLFHQLIEHPRLNGQLFLQIIDLINSRVTVSQDVSESFKKGLSHTDHRGNSAAHTLLKRNTLLIETSFTMQNSAIFETIILALITELGRSPETIVDCLLLMSLEMPELFYKMLELISTDERHNNTYASLLMSLHTPTLSRANSLYLHLREDPSALEKWLDYINTDRFGADQAQKVALGFTELLAIPTDYVNNCFSILQNSKKSYITPKLIAFSALNFDAHKRLNSFCQYYHMGHQLPSISQTKIITIFIKYLTLEQPADDNMSKAIRAQTNLGLCFGFSLLFGVFNRFGMEYWWNDLLRTISMWDGSPEQLKNSYRLIDSDREQTLETLIIRAMNYLVSAQGLSDEQVYNDFFGDTGDMFQLYRSKEFTVYVKNNSGIDIPKKIQSMDCVGGYFPPEELRDLLNENKELIGGAGNVTLIDSLTHSCTIIYDTTQGVWSFYDCNKSYGTVNFSSTDDLVKYIADGFVQLVHYDLKLFISSFDDQNVKINASTLYKNKFLLFGNGPLLFYRAMRLSRDNNVDLIKYIEHFNTDECRKILADSLFQNSEEHADILQWLLKTELVKVGEFINQSPEAAATARINIVKQLLKFNNVKWMNTDLLSIFLEKNVKKDVTTIPTPQTHIDLLIDDVLQFKHCKYRVSNFDACLCLEALLNAQNEDAKLNACIQLIPHTTYLNDMPVFLVSIIDFIQQHPKYTKETQRTILSTAISELPSRLQDIAFETIQSKDDKFLTQASRRFLKQLITPRPTNPPAIFTLFKLLNKKNRKFILHHLFASLTDIENLEAEIKNQIINYMIKLERNALKQKLVTSLLQQNFWASPVKRLQQNEATFFKTLISVLTDEMQPISLLEYLPLIIATNEIRDSVDTLIDACQSDHNAIQKALLMSLENLSYLNKNTQEKVISYAFKHDKTVFKSLKIQLINVLIEDGVLGAPYARIKSREQNADFIAALISLLEGQIQPINLLRYLPIIIDEIPDILVPILNACIGDREAIKNALACPNVLVTLLNNIAFLEQHTQDLLFSAAFHDKETPFNSLKLNLLNDLLSKEDNQLPKITRLKEKNNEFLGTLLSLLAGEIQPIHLLPNLALIIKESPDTLDALLDACMDSPTLIQEALVNSLETIKSLEINKLIRLLQCLNNKNQLIDFLPHLALIIEQSTILHDMLQKTFKEDPILLRRILINTLAYANQQSSRWCLIEQSLKSDLEKNNTNEFGKLQFKLFAQLMKDRTNTILLRSKPFIELMSTIHYDEKNTHQQLIDLYLFLQKNQLLKLTHSSLLGNEIIALLKKSASNTRSTPQSNMRIELLLFLLQTYNYDQLFPKLSPSAQNSTTFLFDFIEGQSQDLSLKFLTCFVNELPDIVHGNINLEGTRFSLLLHTGPNVLFSLLKGLEETPDLANEARIKIAAALQKEILIDDKSHFILQRYIKHHKALFQFLTTSDPETTLIINKCIHSALKITPNPDALRKQIQQHYALPDEEQLSLKGNRNLTFHHSQPTPTAVSNAPVVNLQNINFPTKS